jgi:Tfp pilus assembly protein PilN
VNHVHIDFAAPSLRRTLFHTSVQAWLVAALALVLCAGAAFSGWHQLVQQRVDRQRLAQVREHSAAIVAAPPAVAAVHVSEQQAAAVNADVLQLNLPWRALRDAIAAGTPPGIALLALEPDARSRKMRITAEAKNSDEMVGYVVLLKQQDLFDSVVLTRHEVSEQDPNRPLRFQVEAQWRAP